MYFARPSPPPLTASALLDPRFICPFLQQILSYIVAKKINGDEKPMHCPVKQLASGM
jgi:hypothetical protein